MTIKIPGAVKKLCTVCFRRKDLVQKCSVQVTQFPQNPAPLEIYPPYYAIKLAKVWLTPKLKLLSFRVSKNYLYLSFARSEEDLQEFSELCAEEPSLLLPLERHKFALPQLCNTFCKSL